jgi:hypothetical protein
MSNNKNVAVIEPSSIDELFSDLYNRLEELADYRKHFHTWEGVEDKFSTLKISRYYFKFPLEESRARITILLKEVEILKQRGREIIDKISIETFNEWNEPYLRNMPFYYKTVEATEELVYSTIQRELLYYETNLNSILEEIRGKINSGNEKNIEAKQSGANAEFDFSHLKAHSNDVRLDKYQTALLFNYLKATKLILDYDNTPLASIVEALTGHSKNTMRSAHGFGAIHDIQIDNLPVSLSKQPKGKFHNLNRVKDSLQLIIDEIDKTITKESKKLKNL